MKIFQFSKAKAVFANSDCFPQVSIQKPDAGWWRGDYGGLRSHWFPANFTRLEESQLGLEDNNDSLESPDNLKRGQFSQLRLLFIFYRSLWKGSVFTVVLSIKKKCFSSLFLSLFDLGITNKQKDN